MSLMVEIFLKKNKNTIIIGEVGIESEENLLMFIKEKRKLGVFDENTKIRVKLKLNLNEYLILTNCYFSTLVYFE